MKSLPLSARAYVLCVGAAGMVLLPVALAGAAPVDDPVAFGLLLVLAILGEFCLIKAPLGTAGVDLTFSMAFALTLLLAFGAPYAALASVIASVLSDVLNRKSWWKTMFNAAQFALVSLVAGGVLQAVSGTSHLDPATAYSDSRDLVATAAAALVYFAINNLLLLIAIALAEGEPIIRLIRQESGYQLAASMGMFGLAPIAVVATGRSAWLLPVLIIPLAVAYQSTVVSVAKEHESLHDSLTGLPNRVLFRLRAIEAISGTSTTRGSAAVLLIDLDRFKEINDTLGHGTGDLVLQALGPRLLDAVGDDHAVARLGGDEFGVVLGGLGDVGEAEAIAERILGSIREPIRMADLDLEVGASIGIAFQGAHGDDADTLIQRADIAMYAAKESGGGHAVYSSVLDHTSPMRLSIVSELRRAIDAGSLVVYYQPKVNVSTGVVCGAEALVRWNHPMRGLIQPDDFIPIAEQSGAIRELTMYVLKESIAATARWRRSGHEIPVSVNISARTLHDLDLPATIIELIDVEGIQPASLLLEITESSIMSDPERAISALEQLRSVGVEISMDDYGTGHSSLAQIKSMPINELKIDKSFITYMTEGSSDALIAASTVDLARRLGLRVVAEGVETSETWSLLHAMGCEQMQGFFFSRPVPEAQFIEWVDHNERTGRLGAGPAAGGAAGRGVDHGRVDPTGEQVPTSG